MASLLDRPGELLVAVASRRWPACLRIEAFVVEGTPSEMEEDSVLRGPWMFGWRATPFFCCIIANEGGDGATIPATGIYQP